MLKIDVQTEMNSMTPEINFCEAEFVTGNNDQICQKNEKDNLSI